GQTVLMSDLTLLPETEQSRPDEALAGPFASVAIERSLDRVLDYSVPPRLVSNIRVGQRVRVPLGRKNRPTHGYIVGLSDTTSLSRVKPILALDDERVLLTPPMLELARWISRYYCAALGTVIETIIPSAVRKRVGIGYQR